MQYFSHIFYLTKNRISLKIESKFFVLLHGEYNASLALWNHHVTLLLQISSGEDLNLRIENFAIDHLQLRHSYSCCPPCWRAKLKSKILKCQQM